MTSAIETRDLGLAAYIKMRGHKLLSFENRMFRLEAMDDDGNERTKGELEIEYANSCCRVHDSLVMGLRQFMS
jgi:hypothetical protein